MTLLLQPTVNKVFSRHSKFLWILLVFAIVHLFYLNYNKAEWGDSYRILRAAESLRSGYYPSDEKRPPLPALLFSTHPVGMDAVLYARMWQMVFSIAAFIAFYFLVSLYIKDNFWRMWAMLAFMFNNVYLYWSIRIMADVPFSFFVVMVVLLFGLWKEHHKNWLLFVAGLLCGLSILTRFEGYLLAFSVVSAILLTDKLTNIRRTSADLLWFGAGSLVFVIPYLLFRNPLTSSYFEEPTGRVYDLRMVAIFILSFFCITGLTFVLYFLIAHFRVLKSILTANLVMSIYVVLELLLILSWPAAVPRLFVPIVPLLVLLVSTALSSYFETKPTKTAEVWDFIWMFLLLGMYVGGQYILKLQFLILDRKYFIIDVILQLVLILLVVKRKKMLFFLFSAITMILWSYLAINLHKDIFISVQSAADYAGRNLSGNIAYNDVSSVSDWYINYQHKKPATKGFYYNTEKKANLDLTNLQQAHIDYLLITNEHNTTMTLDLNKRPYLKEIKVFEYNVNGKKFVSRLEKVL